MRYLKFFLFSLVLIVSQAAFAIASEIMICNNISKPTEDYYLDSVVFLTEGKKLKTVKYSLADYSFLNNTLTLFGKTPKTIDCNIPIASEDTITDRTAPTMYQLLCVNETTTGDRRYDFDSISINKAWNFTPGFPFTKERYKGVELQATWFAKHLNNKKIHSVNVIKVNGSFDCN